MSAAIVSPVPVDARIREHVLGHLTPLERRLMPLLVQPLTLDQVAERADYWSRRAPEDHWRRIRDRLRLADDDTPSTTARIGLVRVAYGIDPCYCERRA